MAHDAMPAGVDQGEYFNETLRPGDQSGGESGNTQTWQSVYWHNGSSWNQVTGTAGAWCDAHERATMGCKWHSSDNTIWNSWDTSY